MKKPILRILAVFLLSAILLLNIAAAVFAYDYDYSEYEQCGIEVCEVNTNTVVLANNAEERYYPASITKLMTALCAVEIINDPSYVITVTKEMLSIPKPDSSLAGLSWGEKLTLEQMLYAMLLPSGNDAAIATAVAAGKVLSGSKSKTSEAYGAFIAYMNKKAEEAGMINTHFSNADGYDDENNYSTPHDMIILGKLCIQNELIMKVSGTRLYRITTNAATHEWDNTDCFIHPTYDFTYRYEGVNPYYDERVLGLKTGFTDIGLRCFMFFAKTETQAYVGIVMRVPEEPYTLLWDIVGEIKDYSFDAFTNTNLVSEDEYKIDIKVSNPGNILNGELSSVTAQTAFISVPKDKIGEITKKTVFDPSLKLTQKGKLRLNGDISTADKVFTVNYYLDGSLLASADYYSSEDIQCFGFSEAVMYFAILACICALVVAPIRKIKKNKKSHGRKNTEDS